MVPSASVEVSNEGTGVTRKVTTSSAGVFNVPNLDIGNYRIRVSAQGFAAYERAGLYLTANQIINLDVELPLSTTTGVVEVAGAVALLVPGLASIGALWLGFTMVGAVATHLFVLHTSPVPAIVLGVLNAVVVYLRRDELVALLHRLKG